MKLVKIDQGVAELTRKCAGKRRFAAAAAADNHDSLQVFDHDDGGNLSLRDSLGRHTRRD
jgi:hypothetical protein